MGLVSQRDDQHRCHGRKNPKPQRVELGPPQPTGQQDRGTEGSHDEDQRRRQMPSPKLGADFEESPENPPASSPGQRQRRHSAVDTRTIPVPVQQPTRRQTSNREHPSTQEVLVDNRQWVFWIQAEPRSIQVHHERQTSQGLQERAATDGKNPFAAATEPHQKDALQRPHRRRVVGVERERNSEGQERHR